MSTPVDDARDDVEEDVEDDADHDSPVSSESEAPPDPKIVTDTVDIDVFPGTVRNVPRQAVVSNDYESTLLLLDIMYCCSPFLLKEGVHHHLNTWTAALATWNKSNSKSTNKSLL